MLVLVKVVGILVLAVILAILTSVLLRIIVEVIRLRLISRHKGNDTSYKCTSSRYDFSYRKILFYGFSSLHSLLSHIYTGFYDVFTFIDGIPNPQPKECHKKTKKQHRNFTHDNRPALYLHNSDYQKIIGLFAIGFGISIFLIIAFMTWSISPLVLRVVLIATCVGALFVGIFSLRKDYQPDNKEDYRANESLRVLVSQNTNKGTDYHQAYTHPLYHYATSLFRRIIRLWKKGVNHNGKEPAI